MTPMKHFIISPAFVTATTATFNKAWWSPMLVTSLELFVEFLLEGNDSLATATTVPDLPDVIASCGMFCATLRHRCTGSRTSLIAAVQTPFFQRR